MILIGEIKHEYLRSRASRCLSLSSSSGDRYSNLTTIELIVLVSWILHPGIFFKRVGNTGYSAVLQIVAESSVRGFLP